MELDERENDISSDPPSPQAGGFIAWCRKYLLDPSLIVMLGVGFVVTASVLPTANSPDSLALCFAPPVIFACIYAASRFIERWWTPV